MNSQEVNKVEPLTPELHRDRHHELHRSLDDLAADWLDHQPVGGKSLSNTTIMELMEWSYQQTVSPTDPKR